MSKPRPYYYLKDIPELAKKIAQDLKGGEVLGLVGPLGSGKTAFTKTLGKRLKIRHTISSPTFVIMNCYPFKLKGRTLHLYHLDLYRLKNFKDAAALGIKEIWADKNAVVVIEWADKIMRYLPKKTQKIYFEHTNEQIT